MKYDRESIRRRRENGNFIKKIIAVVLIILIYNLTLIFISTSNEENKASLFGYKAYVITSSSMEPTIKEGSVVIVRKCSQENIKNGDIITYHQNNKVVTHRIVNDEGENYKTKGDNNNVEDTEEISYDKIEGKVVLTIPNLGKVITTFGNQFLGLAILLIILVICLYMISKREKIESRRNKKKINDENQAD